MTARVKVIPKGTKICQKKKDRRKRRGKPAVNAYLIENRSQVPPRRRIAMVRIVRVAFMFRRLRARRIVTRIHRSSE
jgi:hypothetical protein